MTTTRMNAFLRLALRQGRLVVPRQATRDSRRGGTCVLWDDKTQLGPSLGAHHTTASIDFSSLIFKFFKNELLMSLGQSKLPDKRHQEAV